jgi:hypothetical protein
MGANSGWPMSEIAGTEETSVRNNSELLFRQLHAEFPAPVHSFQIIFLDVRTFDPDTFVPIKILAYCCQGCVLYRQWTSRTPFF